MLATRVPADQETIVARDQLRHRGRAVLAQQRIALFYYGRLAGKFRVGIASLKAQHNDEGARTNRGTINSKKRFLRGERQAFDALGSDGGYLNR